MSKTRYKPVYDFAMRRIMGCWEVRTQDWHRLDIISMIGLVRRSDGREGWPPRGWWFGYLRHEDEIPHIKVCCRTRRTATDNMVDAIRVGCMIRSAGRLRMPRRIRAWTTRWAGIESLVFAESRVRARVVTWHSASSAGYCPRITEISVLRCPERDGQHRFESDIDTCWSFDYWDHSRERWGEDQ